MDRKPSNVHVDIIRSIVVFDNMAFNRVTTIIDLLQDWFKHDASILPILYFLIYEQSLIGSVISVLQYHIKVISSELWRVITLRT